MKTKIKKTFSISILVISLMIAFFTSVLNANEMYRGDDFRKKISVENFGPPAGWDKSYAPGTMIADSIRKTLQKKGYFVIPDFQLSDAELNPMSMQEDLKMGHTAMDDSSMPKAVATNMGTMNGEMGAPSVPDGMSNDKIESLKKNLANMNSRRMETTEKRLRKRIINPAQILIRGSVWTFSPSSKVMPLSDEINDSGMVPVETSRIKFDIELLDTMTGSVLWRGDILSQVRGGEKRFDSKMLKEWPYNNKDFELTSLGSSFNTAVADAVEKIENRLKQIPLEGQVIAIDENNKIAWINLGKDSNVTVREVFNVYSVKFDWKDPDSHVSLGDEFILQGAVKILDPQAGISRAKILAGDMIKPGYVARLRVVER
ncbi:MAG: hypothetical protein COV66_03960 [Nitrospinae bacterium CG11_big_fil_rev_8_21_14_0_20_45_15]|nr:MAG: hypothetical protein COV66_03960 [Nitrospinae bacterium CG11_big_fil_rev_8_21_14_0_20_45_15]